MINKVTLVGNSGGEPKTREYEGGQRVANISLATNENYKDKNGEWQTQTEWHTVIGWNHLADTINRRVKKGTLVYVEGKLKTRKYEDKEGITRWKTEVQATKIRVLEKMEEGERNFPSQASNEGNLELANEPNNTPDAKDDDPPF